MKILSLLLILMIHSVFAREEELGEIDVVEEDAQGLVDFVPGVIRLTGPELLKRRQTTIGDTLSVEAGVQSTNFGPNASRPVIRGLDGERIRLLQNGLMTLDASSQSLDHAIPVDVLNIEKIEIFRGAMSLLYGSSAVGGIVNLVTDRIHREYEEGFFSKYLVQGETVSDGFTSAAQLNYGVNKWMFRVDGSYRNLGDIEIPGYARTDNLRRDEPLAGEEKGRLLNSANQMGNIAAAASRILDNGYAGLSFNHFNNIYGTVVEENVLIDMTQNRYEFHSEYRFLDTDLFEAAEFKASRTEYFHRELEDNITGTIFRNEGTETRLMLVNKGKNWNGVSGVHTLYSSFDAEGDEAFLPSAETSQVSLFTFQQLGTKIDAFRVGGRIENHHVDKEGSVNFGLDDKKNFLAYSASVGYLHDFRKKRVMETSLSFTERPPTFQEIYSNGEHVATGTFEIGDEDLIKEKSTAFEVTFKNETGKLDLVASAYTQVFNDYIALLPTGNLSNGLAEYSYEQIDALFYGVDLDSRYLLDRVMKGSLFLVNRFDFVRAKDRDSGENLARISPPRVTTALEYESLKWSADIEGTYVAPQTKIAAFETRTDDYFLTSVGVAYHVVDNLTAFDVYLRLRNLFDIEARNHVSVIKDIAPLPGRNLIAGLQFQF